MTSVTSQNKPVAVIGAGLAGCEAAWLLVRNGIPVDLFEMKPDRYSEAHVMPGFAELVCSNSLKSMSPGTPSAMLKAEMAGLGSIMMAAAAGTQVPAGEALAVDRTRFSELVTAMLTKEPLLAVRHGEADALPEGYDRYVIATGPLTSETFAEEIGRLVGGGDFLYFYDAIAPIIDADSIDGSRVFFGSRYGKGGADDYLNIPLTEEQYRSFVAGLLDGQKVPFRPFEKERFYEGCLPIEVLAARGPETLAFGPMKPVGFTEAEAGFRPYAVIQLRREDADGTSYNMVGFQTRLVQKEQERLFRTLPGLEHALFLRYGSIHRNTFIDAPDLLGPALNLRSRPEVYFAGQITGVEGYVESAACGIMAGLFVLGDIKGCAVPAPPRTTAMGALLSHLATEQRPFQPSGIHMGLFEKERLRRKADRKAAVHAAEQLAFARWSDELTVAGLRSAP